MCSPISTSAGLGPFSCCEVSVSGADDSGGIVEEGGTVSSAMMLEVGPGCDGVIVGWDAL